MPERRPSLKRPGITMTGRQHKTVEALQADGWLVLSIDPTLWTDDQLKTLRDRLAQLDAAHHTDT